MTALHIRDTSLHRTGEVLTWDGNTAAVMWRPGQFTEVTKQQLESGRYRLVTTGGNHA